MNTKIRKRVAFTLTEDEFNGLAVSVRRKLIERWMFIETEKYTYCIGTVRWNKWALVRIDARQAIQDDEFGRRYPEGVVKETVDTWM